MAIRRLDPVGRYSVNDGPVRTSELAGRAAVNPQTLRYYDGRGAPDKAGPVGRRLPLVSAGGGATGPVHQAGAAPRVHLGGGGDAAGLGWRRTGFLCRVQALTTEKIADLRRRIADLRALETGPTRLAATCDRSRGQRECPILQELDP